MAIVGTQVGEVGADWCELWRNILVGFPASTIFSFRGGRLLTKDILYGARRGGTISFSVIAIRRSLPYQLFLFHR